MAKRKSKRVVSHEVMGTLGAHTVHYTLQKTAALSRKTAKGEADKRTAFARVVYREKVRQQELEDLILEQNPLLKPELVQYVLRAMVRVLKEQLKIGRNVTLQDFISFGVAFEGRVDPERPLDVRHLPLIPKTRFSRTFIDDLNTNTRIAYHEGLLPPRVDIKKFIAEGNVILLTGEFRHPEVLAADILTASGEVIPCDIRIPEHTARTAVPSLTILPKTSFPAGSTLQLQWVDGANESRKLAFEL